MRRPENDLLPDELVETINGVWEDVKTFEKGPRFSFVWISTLSRVFAKSNTAIFAGIDWQWMSTKMHDDGIRKRHMPLLELKDVLWFSARGRPISEAGAHWSLNFDMAPQVLRWSLYNVSQVPFQVMVSATCASGYPFWFVYLGIVVELKVETSANS